MVLGGNALARPFPGSGTQPCITTVAELNSCGSFLWVRSGPIPNTSLNALSLDINVP
jgi:hypothetical protein